MKQMNQNELYDIFPVWHIPFWQTTWFYWTVACFAILTASLATYFLYRWYQSREKPEANSWEIALTLIEELQRKQYTTAEQSKQCYFILTSALKAYLNSRFSYPIARATDEQAAQYIEQTDLNKQLKINIQEVLRGCIFIKFANAQALDEQVQEHLRLAQELVKATIPEKESSF